MKDEKKIKKTNNCGPEKIAVIGGGMSGLCTAILLAEGGKQVFLYERQDRIGKKLLLTGNGRCNVSNVAMGCDFYRSDDSDHVEEILNYCDTDREKAFWERLGMKLRESKGGLYPVTNQAATVLDCLRFRISELGINVQTDTFCEGIHGKRGDFTIDLRSADGGKNSEKGFSYVFLCCGGLAGVYGEEEKNGYGIAKALHHTVRTGHPALVPVICNETMKALAGIRTQAHVSLYSGDSLVAEDTGELQLTKEGISGIPVFQLTRYLDSCRDSYFVVDFLPYPELEDLKSTINSRRALLKDRTLEQFFAGWLQKKLTLYLLKRFDMKPDRKVSDLSEKQFLYLVQNMKQCRFTPASLGNYRQAQVSVGGIPLAEVDEHLESRRVPGIFITGEMLDVTGACGGYNLHFALASAYAAASRILPM